MAHHPLLMKMASGTPGVVTDGLVLHLDAGDSASYPGTGTTWSDLSGQGNDYTLTNGPTYNSGNGGHIVFDGTNDHAVGSTTGFSFGSGTSESTIQGWFRMDTSTSSFRMAVAYGDDQTSAARFIGTNSSDNIIVGGFANDQTASTTSWTTGTWINVATTYDNTNCNVYVNGTNEGAGTVTWNTIDVEAYIASQVFSTPGEFWPGSIAQILIYDRELSATEVTQNYNAILSRF